MKLALGTVQFGLDYGISNKGGQTSLEEVKKILAIAKQNNILTLDTANAYGNSEEVLGQFADSDFEIITKIQMPIDFVKSLKNLKRKNIYGLMFHNVDILIQNPEYWQALKIYKNENKVKKIGVSVYNKEQIDYVIANYQIDIIQLPINVLDQKLIKSGCLKRLKDNGIEIHARSVFLQGLLLMDNIPTYFNPIKTVLNDYFEFLKTNNLSKQEGALGFAKNLTEIDKIVIGVNSSQQLQENINAYNREVDMDFTRFSIENESFLNPSMWEIVK